MFHVVVGGKEKCVMFKHEYQTVHIVQKDGTKVDQRRPVKTNCSIIEGDDTIGKGMAACNPVDQFEYYEGRKRSLKRALTDSGFSRAERTIVWNTFYNKEKVPE